MKLPDTPNKGDALEASWGEDVVRYLRALTPQPSPTVKPSMKPGGTTYKAAKPTPPAATDAAPLPWAPIVLDEYGNVTFVPGLVAGYMPKIGATPLDDDPQPSIEITTTGTVYFEIEVTDDLLDPGAGLVLKNAAATPADTLTKAFVTLHHVRRTVDAGVVTLAWAIGRHTSLDVWRCDGMTRVRRA